MSDIMVESVSRPNKPEECLGSGCDHVEQPHFQVLRKLDPVNRLRDPGSALRPEVSQKAPCVGNCEFLRKTLTGSPARHLDRNGAMNDKPAYCAEGHGMDVRGRSCTL